MNKKCLILACSLVFLVGCNANENNNENIENDTSQIEVSNNVEDNTDIEVEDNVEVEAEQVEISLLPLYKENTRQFGYVDASDLDTFVIEAKYDRVGYFNEFGTTYVYSNDQYEIIDTKGDVVSKINGVSVQQYGNYFFSVTKIGSHFLIDHSGLPTTFDPYDDIQVQFGHLTLTKGDNVYVLNEDTDEVEFVVENEDYRRFYLAVEDSQSDIKRSYDEENYQYYYDKDGEKIGPFALAEAFVDGFAICGMAINEDVHYLNENYYGLIDENLQYVFEPEYTYLEQLGNEYYSVSTLNSMENDYLYIVPYSENAFKKALYKGTEPVTEEIFFNIKPIGNDLFLVDDGKDNYVIDDQGQKHFEDYDIPVAYNYVLIDDVYLGVYGNDESFRIYFNDDVFLHQTKTEKTNIGSVTYTVTEKGPSLLILPTISIADEMIESKINDAIHKHFVIEESGHDYYEAMTSDEVKATLEENLVKVQNQYYWYGFGAAHGQYGFYYDYYHLNDGELIEFDELFVEGTDVEQYLAELLADYDYENPYFYQDLENQTREERIDYFKGTYFAYDIHLDDLVISFMPYEVGPYAAGVISFYFDISLLDHIDSNSRFFK